MSSIIESTTLELYFQDNPEAMMDISYHLDSINGWKLIISELRKFRIPVYVNQNMLEKAKSPSTFLINELIMRSCTVNDFKEILKKCNLLDTLAFLEENEPPKIIIQPGEDYEKVFVFFGEELRLECVATGIPPPTYQWFCDNVPLPNCDSSVMTMSDFRESSEGEYYCIVTQCTKDCTIEVRSNIVVCTLLDSLPEFVQNLPSKLVVPFGAEIIKLEVEIYCRSKYAIEWIKQNQILEGKNDCVLVLKNIKKSDTGIYRCVAKNSAGEVYSDECQILVLREKRRRRASAKVALLIANSKYNNFNNLKTPIEDCLLLAEKLEKLNFHVITLIDLTLREMHHYIDWFFESVPPEAYAFVCYVGHGFSLANNKFMMPIDCPKESEYRIFDCILDELLVKKAAESNLKLLVFVLDMCLEEPNREVSAAYEDFPDYRYIPNSKFSKVQAFATSSHQGAYECPNMPHGFYIPHLCKYLDSDMPVIQVFELAHQEFQKNKVVELQKPSLSYNTDLTFKLTDPVEESFTSLDRIGPFVHVRDNLKYEHELFFPEVNLNTTLFATPHRGRILNAIDMKFTQTILNKYIVTLDADSPVDLGYACVPSTKDNESFLTLYNLQKVKTNIYLTIFLAEVTEPHNRLSNIVIDLGIPLIAST
ncbi:mucosa-associated lymphoid tissue lymphoma translocation protein 1 [Halyomorpha halys]|uniref:mucosa-associated lymphoid tissue lymphoma translocation protein 1 n=1 Tax=Halyomorpha halys TaxID=286706 RepID=UPI000D0C759E|nr:mucosa-associated lymphoid tissue lymphoma translocation protein 1 [Halyomorpha halys]